MRTGTVYYNITRNYTTTINNSGYQKFELSKEGRALAQQPALEGIISALYIYTDQLSSIAGMQVVMTADEDGDYALLPITNVGISAGMTTATKGSSVIKVEVVMADAFPTFIWIRSNTVGGTARVTQVKLTWRV